MMQILETKVKDGNHQVISQKKSYFAISVDGSVVDFSNFNTMELPELLGSDLTTFNKGLLFSLCAPSFSNDLCSSSFMVLHVGLLGVEVGTMAGNLKLAEIGLVDSEHEDFLLVFDALDIVVWLLERSSELFFLESIPLLEGVEITLVRLVVLSLAGDKLLARVVELLLSPSSSSDVTSFMVMLFFISFFNLNLFND